MRPIATVVVFIPLLLASLAGVAGAKLNDRPPGFTAIAVSGGSLWLSGGDGTVTMVALDDPTRIRRTIRSGTFAFAVAASDDSVWASDDYGFVTQFDSTSGTIRRRFALSAWRPTQLAFTAERLWIVDSANDRVLRLDPRSGRIEARVSVRERVRSVATGENALWVQAIPRGTQSTGPAGARVIRRLDPDTNRFVGPAIRLGCDAEVAAASRVLWVADVCRQTLTRYDARTGRPSGRSVHLEGEPVSLVATTDSVWVSTLSGVRRIDTRTGRLVATVAVRVPGDLVIANGLLWVAGLGERVITRIDPRSNRVIGKPIPIPLDD